MQNANAKKRNTQKAKPFTPLPKGRGKAACGGLGVGLFYFTIPFSKYSARLQRTF